MSVVDCLNNLFAKFRDIDETTRVLYTLAATVGFLVTPFFALKLLFATIQAFRLYFLSQFSCCQNTLKYGKWAVVTGATDGIGQSMAKEFAQRGHSILVIGRNELKLVQTKKLLEAIPKVGQVETIKIDLSDSSLENYQRILGQLDADNRDIGILVNNAGLCSEVFMLYHDYSLEQIRQQVNVNVLALAYFTNIILPGMLSRKRGLIMNISSVLSETPLGYTAMYGPTKALINSFSRLLQFEYSSLPIDIINVTPGSVDTKLMRPFGFTSWSFLRPSSDSYARSVINAAKTRIGSYSGCLGHGATRATISLADNLGVLKLGFLAIQYGLPNLRLQSPAKQ